MIKTEKAITLEHTSFADDIRELKLIYFNDTLAEHRIIGEQNNIGEEVLVYLIYTDIDAYKLKGVVTEKGIVLDEEVYLPIIGEIDNGRIIKDWHVEGYVYKNYVAFELKEGICYVPEHTDEDITINSTVTEGAYTYQDFLDLAGGNEQVAWQIFDGVTWEYPETYLDQSTTYVRCDCCGWVCDEEQLENPNVCPKCNYVD